MGASGDDTIALVQGASRGIGQAFVRRLLDDPGIARLYATCRDPDGAAGLQALAAEDERLVPLRLDLLDPDSIRAAAEEVRAQSGRLDLLINCAGILHEGGMTPERSLADVDPDNMVRAFRVNALGALLVARAFEPCLRRSRAARFVCLSARVGSIGDNRLGGWYAYRASKAALNQVVRTASIEIARSRREAVVVGLHPGTVDTGLSAPFSGNVAPGKLFTPVFSASRLVTVLDGLAPGDTGKCFAWDGSEVPA